MADHIDTANDYAERLNAEALAQRTKYRGHSAEFCIECGNQIPVARQESICGVQTCVECASARERRLA